MFDLEVVTPITKDGIEFYVSADGSKSGMSQTGLGVFCGVSEKSIFSQGRIGDKLSQQEVPAWEAPEVLKPFQGKVFHLDLTGNNRAKIVTAEACAAFVEYYAFDSKAANGTAKYSYRKFATKGIHQWIKESAGAIEAQNGSQLLVMMQQILSEVRDLKQIATKYNAIREHTSTYMPGAEQLLDDLEDSGGLLLSPCEDGKMSLEAWLLSVKGITLDKPRFHKLAVLVAENYRALTKKEPERRKFVIGRKAKYNVSVYEPEVFPVLQMCLNKLLV